MVNRVLRYAINLIFVYIFLFAFLGFCYDKLNPVPTNVLHEKFSDRKTHIEREIIIDSKFTDFEKGLIQKAAEDWQLKSAGVFNFKLIENLKGYEFNNKTLYIANVSKNYPSIFAMEHINAGSKGYGYYEEKTLIKSIVLVGDVIEDIYFYPVILHEFGHALGLEHNLDFKDENTIMFPLISDAQSGITEKDLNQFCLLYKCVKEKK